MTELTKERCLLAVVTLCVKRRNSIAKARAERVDWQPPVAAYDFTYEAASNLVGSMQKVLAEAAWTTPHDFYMAARAHALAERDKLRALWKTRERTLVEDESFDMATDELDQTAFILKGSADLDVSRNRWLEGGEHFMPVMINRTKGSGNFLVWPAITISGAEEIIDLLPSMGEATALAARLNNVRSYLGRPLDAIAGPVILSKLDEIEARMKEQA